MRCIHCVRSSISVCRNRARERHWRTCSGGIHASGKPAIGEQLAQPARVLAIGLRAPLATPQRARLHRLGQMRHRARRRERVADEQPARARLDRDIDPRPAKRLAHARHGRRRGVDPPAHHLARLGVQRVEGDLRSMHIKPGYDRHQGLLSSSGIATSRESSRAEPEGARVHAIFAREAAEP